MKIRKVIIKNFKCFKESFSLEFDEKVNIIVGLNDAGKSTILEAIHLALSGSFRGNPLKNELSQYLFNKEIEKEYISHLQDSGGSKPPEINIEVFFHDKDELAELRGNGNSDNDDAPGVKYCIEFDEQYKAEYEELIKSTETNTIPIEYYKVTWLSFARNLITSRSIPVKSVLIDSTNTCFYNKTDTYVLKIIRNNLDNKERVGIAQAHRQMKETFMKAESVKGINDKINENTDENNIINKKVQISVNLSTQNAWENSLMAYLEEIPFHHIGKGEQSLVKTHLALNHKKSQMANIILLEEPENHLSHSKLNALLHKINSNLSEKQIIVSTHNSFVANTIGLNTLIVLHDKHTIRLKDLSSETYKFFRKLPGYDTLRLVLCKKAILVEGPSDELIIQKAYMVKNENKLPIHDGIDVISVGKSFLRFLEIAEKIKKDVVVVTDNDGDVVSLKKKYKNYLDKDTNIKICYHKSTEHKTLEPCMLAANNLPTLNEVFGKKYEKDEKLLEYMKKNKVKCALQIFDTDKKITFPDYINDAIQ